MSAEVTIDVGAKRDPLPGARLRGWTLRKMLAEPARDVRAARGRGSTALVLGCGDGALSAGLAELGYLKVMGADSRRDRLEAAETMRLDRGLPNDRLRFCPLSDLEDGAEFDLIVIEELIGAGADELAVLRRARPITRGICAIASRARLASRDLALDAGFEHVSLVQPPADAERSFVLLQRALLIARPPQAGDDG